MGGVGGWLNLEHKFLGVFLSFGTPFIIIVLCGVPGVIARLVLVFSRSIVYLSKPCHLKWIKLSAYLNKTRQIVYPV